MDDQQDPQDAARDELLRQITDNAKQLETFNQATRAKALLELAEAYAYVICPDNAH